MSRGRRMAVALWLLTVAGCGAGRPLIVIGTQDDTEQRLLGHLAALMIKSRLPVRIDQQFNLDDLPAAYRALERGDLDVYPANTGMVLSAILKRPRPAGGPDQVYRRVRDTLNGRGLRVLSPLGFSDTDALLMRRGEAQRWGVRSISDLSGRNGWWRLGGTAEFVERPDGWPGLRRAYGLSLRSRPRRMEPASLFAALSRGAVEVVAGSATDGRVAVQGLTVLEDDRQFFPPSEACLIIRARALERCPALEVVLERLSGKITLDVMQRLNAAVDIEGRPAESVAADFLRSQELIP